jgi:tetratricopeptide (TPR) repeat protein
LTQEAELARSNEAKLRRQAEARERITQAEILVSQGRFNEADTMISEASPTEPGVESAALIRSLSEWHALHGRWTQAADRFGLLLQVNQLDGWDQSTLDFIGCGVCLIESGGADHYDLFSQAALSRFVATSNAVAAERTLKTCVLIAPSQSVMESLVPLARLAGKSFATADSREEEADFRAAWGSVSMALWEYRRGHYAESIKWARRCLAYPDNNAPRAATAHVELALALYQTGQNEEALRELNQGRQSIENKFNEVLELGSPAQGFWFDWVFARILLREAPK